jgi:hypothetical protein
MNSLEQVHCFVAEVRRETIDSSKTFPELFRNGEPKYPIPFFGNLLDAEIFTVGLNPSAGEFVNRGWQHGFSDELLANRLLDYFSSPHDWFRVWSEALRLLNGSPSYESGRVAHLDISPRATQSFASLSPEQSEHFDQMLRQDIRWLFHLITQSANLKLILMAGVASKKCYLDRLVGECAAEHSCKLTGKESANGIQSRFWRLERNGKSIPIFFSGSSPSNRRNPKRLVENVRANIDSLNARLESSDSH